MSAMDTTTVDTSNKVPVIEARQISKHFGHVVALRGVDLTLWPNEVLGVVGDNGAGKSTLMKVLSGVHPASDGEMLIDGTPVRFSNPGDARRMGIEMVYQDLALAGNMRNHKANQVKAMEHLDNLRIHVKSVSQRVEELSGGQRQAVAVARATAFEAKVVIMDEPTAALAVKEVAKVLDMIKDLRDKGISVILISHRLDDVFYVCDRVMALYHGQNFQDAPLSQIDRNDVVGWIMGNKSGQGVDPSLDRN